MIPDELSEKNFWASLVAGFAAGTIQDCVLYPVDTIKSRLQNEVGFWKSGGFRGIYKGFTWLASGPAGALFFCSYEMSRNFLHRKIDNPDTITIAILSATFAEMVSCLIRVPMENAKNRRLGLCKRCDEHRDYIFQRQIQSVGLRRTLYNGFSTRIITHLPFALVQIPLWEYFRSNLEDRQYEYSLVTLIPIKIALCGALASAVTAVITTPLDIAVAKAMQCPLKAGKKQFVFSILQDLHAERGFTRLFAGCGPRVFLITIGGAVFFGAYDYAHRIFGNVQEEVLNNGEI